MFAGVIPWIFLGPIHVRGWMFSATFLGGPSTLPGAILDGLLTFRGPVHFRVRTFSGTISGGCCGLSLLYCLLPDTFHQLLDGRNLDSEHDISQIIQQKVLVSTVKKARRWKQKYVDLDGTVRWRECLRYCCTAA